MAKVMRVIDEKLYHELMDIYKAHQIQRLHKEFTPAKPELLDSKCVHKDATNKIPSSQSVSTGEFVTPLSSPSSQEPEIEISLEAEESRHPENFVVPKDIKSGGNPHSSPVTIEIPESSNPIPQGWKPVTFADSKKLRKKPAAKRKIALPKNKRKRKKKTVSKKRR